MASCAVCGEARITVVHHVNGDHDDDRAENRIRVCPNCHSLIHLRGYGIGVGFDRVVRIFPPDWRLSDVEADSIAALRAVGPLTASALSRAVHVSPARTRAGLNRMADVGLVKGRPMAKGRVIVWYPDPGKHGVDWGPWASRAATFPHSDDDDCEYCGLPEHRGLCPPLKRLHALTDEQIIGYLSRYLRRWRRIESERPADLKSFLGNSDPAFRLLEVALLHIPRSCLVLRPGEGPRDMWGEPMGAYHWPGEETTRVEICECGRQSVTYRTCVDCGAEIPRYEPHMHIFVGGDPKNHFSPIKPADFRPTS